jgi:hypothetical protein
MALLLLVLILIVGLLLLLSNKGKFLTYFFFLYPILPEYFAVSISDALPLFTASRLLFLMLLVAYLLKEKKISYVILKNEGLWNPFILLIVGYTVLLVLHLSYYNILKTYLNFWIEDVLFILVLVDCLKNENIWKKCCTALLCGGLVVFIGGMSETIIGINYIAQILNTNVRTNILMSAYERYNTLRASFTFGHAICLGVYCVSLLPMIIGRVGTKKSRYLYLFAMDLSCLLMTISRWPIAVGFIIIVWRIMTIDKKTRNRFVIPMLTFFLVIGIVLPFFPKLSASIMTPVYSTLNAFGANFDIAGTTKNADPILGRLSQLQMVLQTLEKKPLIGFGSADFDTMGLTIRSTGGVYKVVSIDNEYLNWFVSYGLIGFICFLNWYRAIIFNLKSELDKINNNDLNSIYYGLVAIMLCYFAVDQLTTNRIFNSLLVLLISGIKIYQDKKEGEVKIEYE